MTDKEHDTKDMRTQGLEPDTSGKTRPGAEKADLNDISDEEDFISGKSKPEPLSSEIRGIIDTISEARGHSRRSQFVILLIAAVLMSIICFYVLTRRESSPAPVAIFAKPSVPNPAPVLPEIQQQEPETLRSTPLETVEVSTPEKETSVSRTIGKKEAAVLDESVSLAAARDLFQRQEYQKACCMFRKLQEALVGDGLKEQCLRDWLSLQMARCLQKTHDYALMDELFTQVLSSKSLVLQAMANYHIAVFQAQNQQYYESSRRIYRTLSLLKIFEQSMPSSMEADCYFMAAESLTRHILRMNNSRELPGSSWMKQMESFELPVQSQEQLADLLMTGIEEMKDVVLMPKVEFYPDRKVGMQWTLKCLNAPVEQIFWQFASESDVSVNWKGPTQEFHNRTISVCLSFVDRHYLAEVIASSAGLIWRYDGHNGTIYDPSNYGDFDELREVLVQEAVSMWQRFLIRYRNHPGAPNAQFCLGRLYTISDEKPMALGIYKLILTQYDQDILAAYALFDMAMIKIDMRDYDGARGDLNELLIRYPDCMIVNEALLTLAEVLMEGGHYSESAQTYDRVLHLELNDEARRKALFGLGRCACRMQDFEATAKWLTEALEMTPRTDDRVGSACFMLGQAYLAMERYPQACDMLRAALRGTQDHDEYVQTVLKLARVECRQEKYLQALNVLESVPQERLNQEDSCRILIEKAQVYRAIGLVDTAMSLLRRQIEYVAEASLRAQLSLELAHCYMLNNDLRIAEKELNEAMYDLPVGYDSQRAGYLLAQIAFQQAEYEKTQSLCLQDLETNIEDEQLRGQVYYLLGQAYTKQQDYHNAALAYAGRLNKGMIP